MLQFLALHPDVTPDHVGLIPTFLDVNDPEPAAKQIDKNYQHGGGWHPSKGFKLTKKFALVYPGDPPLVPLAMSQLRDETILIYPYGYVAIVQPNHDFEASRVD